METKQLIKAKGSFKSFINRYPPVNGLTAKKLLEDFVERKPKFRGVILMHSNRFLDMAYQKIRKKEKVLERIFNERTTN